MTDSSTLTSRLAYDTRVLPWAALTTEEREIIKELNDLLREIKRDNQDKKWDKEHKTNEASPQTVEAWGA